MKLTLILAGNYISCVTTRQIWQKKCLEHGMELDVLELASETGEELARHLNLKSFPALVLGSKIIAVGHPDMDAADKIIKDLK